MYSSLKLEYSYICIKKFLSLWKILRGLIVGSVDITDNDQLNELVEDLKSKNIRIDFLINNAGHLKNETFDKTIESFANLRCKCFWFGSDDKITITNN